MPASPQLMPQLFFNYSYSLRQDTMPNEHRRRKPLCFLLAPPSERLLGLESVAQKHGKTTGEQRKTTPSECRGRSRRHEVRGAYPPPIPAFWIWTRSARTPPP